MLILPAAADLPTNLAGLYAQALQNGHYQPPDNAELARAATLFQSVLEGGQKRDITTHWRELGFVFFAHHERDKTYWVLMEAPEHRRGRGFYVFPSHDPLPILLQAPHGKKDLHTGRIALQWLQEGHFRAAAWNTVPRRYQTAAGNTVEADLAHAEASYLLALSRAFAQRYPGGKIVQLHGFVQHKRTSATGKTATIILSAGSKRPGTTIGWLDACLTRRGFQNVYSYPAEVDELGGTTNAIGKALRAAGHAGFIHLEMNRPLRQSLLRQKLLRDKFRRCIEQLI